MTQEYETDADGNQILDDDGNPIPISSGGMSYGNEPMIELYAVTQEQYDAVLALIDSTTTFVDYDQNVLDIISDEAAGYFAGSKDRGRSLQAHPEPQSASTFRNRNNQLLQNRRTRSGGFFVPAAFFWAHGMIK